MNRRWLFNHSALLNPMTNGHFPWVVIGLSLCRMFSVAFNLSAGGSSNPSISSGVYMYIHLRDDRIEPWCCTGEGGRDGSGLQLPDSATARKGDSARAPRMLSRGSVLSKGAAYRTPWSNPSPSVRHLPLAG